MMFHFKRITTDKFVILTALLFYVGNHLVSCRLRNQWALGPCILQLNEPCYNNERIKFFLYPRGWMKRVELDLAKRTPPHGYNPDLPLKIIAHGYGGKYDNYFVDSIKTSYLEQGKTNVLMVDWSSLARLPCYPWASLNTWQVGRCLGLAVSFLKAPHIHAVGFSLGAHLVSFASNFHYKYFNTTFNRITGLDPALPFFATTKTWLKLDRTDAGFVDVIHTNCGMFGKLEPSGHADFYVNTATIQPMCRNHSNPPICSHAMSTTFFAESILSDAGAGKQGFYGTRCPSYLHLLLDRCNASSTKFDYHVMGEYADPRSKGIFFVQTRNESPYGLGLLDTLLSRITRRKQDA